MRSVLLPSLLLATGCATSPAPEALPPAPQTAQVGVLVMAHGGSDGWNQAVEDVVAGLGWEVPTEIAFGMADPHTLARGLARLETQGVTRVAVVRLFLSGSSFRHQTEYLLGLRADPPRWFVSHGGSDHGTPDPIAHGLELVTHAEGLSDAPGLGRILYDRVDGLRQDPTRETVLLLAHGVGDEEENDRLLARMETAAAALAPLDMRGVHVATLREDWEEKRAVAEREIRRLVEIAGADGGRVIVVPFRLFGAGPYPEVLEGLPHVMAGSLLPHPEVSAWIRTRATRLACDAGWSSPLPCRDRHPVAPRDRHPAT